jgi:hypothetical protein
LDAGLQRAFGVGLEEKVFDRDCHASSVDWTYALGNLVLRFQPVMSQLSTILETRVVILVKPAWMRT